MLANDSILNFFLLFVLSTKGTEDAFVLFVRLVYRLRRKKEKIDKNHSVKITNILTTHM